MRQLTGFATLLLVAAATAAAGYWRWPDLTPALGIAFGGLLLAHLQALLRIGRLEASAGQSASTTGTSGSVQPPAAGSNRALRRRGRGARKAGVVPGRVVKPQNAAEPPPVPPEEQEKVAEFLKVVLEEGDAGDEISFLPPYASDVPADGRTDGEDVPEFPAAPHDEDPGPIVDEEGFQAQAPYGNVPIPRHFALGTVAIIRKALTPAEVAQVLVEQRKRPRERFGDLAVELGLLTDSVLQELLLAQQQGLFTDEEIEEARARIRAFRELEASSALS